MDTRPQDCITYNPEDTLPTAHHQVSKYIHGWVWIREDMATPVFWFLKSVAEEWWHWCTRPVYAAELTEIRNTVDWICTNQKLLVEAHEGINGLGRCYPRHSWTFSLRIFGTRHGL